MREFKGGRKYQGGWFGVANLIGTGIGLWQADEAGDRADAHAARANDISERELELAEKADERSQAMFDRYMEVYAPQEDKLIASIDEGLDIDNHLTRANADVQLAHGRVNEAMTRDLARYGINPADGKFVEAKRLAGLDQAKDLVGAREGARRYVNEEKFRRRGAVTAMGRGLPGAAGAFASQAAAGLDSVGGRYDNLAELYGGLSQQAGDVAGQGLMEFGRWASDHWGKNSVDNGASGYAADGYGPPASLAG